MLIFPHLPAGSNGGSDELKVVATWADGIDEIIAAMILAADNGKINLTDYWAVGDERTVHLSAMTAGDGLNTAQPEQDVVLALMNQGYAGEGNEGVHFVWGQKDCLSEYGRMNTSHRSISWNDSVMKIDLSDKYYNALPDIFRSCLKQFNVITPKTYNGSTNQMSQDYISLFAEKEILGADTYSNTTEANALSQIEYYITTSNRIKQVNGSDDKWWTRSITSKGTLDDGNGFCVIKSDGRVGAFGTAATLGIAPFGCI